MTTRLLAVAWFALLLGGCQATQPPPGNTTAGPQAIEAPRPQTGTDAAGNPQMATPGDDSAAATTSLEEPTSDEAMVAATGQPVGEAQASPAITQTEATPDPTIVALAASFEFPRQGRADAPLQIYEFSDYLCPYCRKLALETVPKVVKDYVNTGQAAITFVDFPLVQLHGYTTLVCHEAAHCAGEEGKYWPMHDAIFRQAEKLDAVGATDEAAARAVLVAMARPAGVDPDRLRICLESGKYRPIVASIMQDAANHGVEMTPTLLVGDQTVPGYVPYEQLKALIDEQLAKQKP